MKKLTLLENFVAKNYENIQNYEKECRFQVSYWSAVLCRTYSGVALHVCVLRAFYVGEHRD